jgi:hypothetical protein
MLATHPHNRPLRLSNGLLEAEGVAVDVAASLRALYEFNVVRTSQKADVVDEGYAWREELNGPRQQVPLVVVAHRRVVRAVDLQAAWQLG